MTGWQRPRKPLQVELRWIHLRILRWIDRNQMAARVFGTPEAAEAAFYEAFAAADMDLMGAVWADGDRALCIHPGSGLLKGRAAVLQSWLEIFSGSTQPAVEYRYIDGYASGDLAVRLAEEQIRPRDEPETAATRLLATNVFLRLDGSWRLGEHHASLPLMVRGKTGGDDRKLH